MFTFTGAALIAALTLPGATHAEPKIAQGQRLWQQRCAECHAVDSDQTGPRHRGVFGRRAGSVPGYDYSRAVRKSGVYWDAATLDRWLTDPEKFIPGQNMDFKVRDKAEREALIAYLSSLTPAPVRNSHAATNTPRR